MLPTDAVISNDDCVEGCVRGVLNQRAIYGSIIATEDAFECRGCDEPGVSNGCHV